MAAQVTKSLLAGKLSATAEQEASKHARDEIDFGIQRLPGGILNGIAKLTKCGFQELKPDSKMKKADGSSAVGEVIFRAEGVVMSPDSVPQPDGTTARAAGLYTSIIIPIFDTRDSKGKVTTQAENFQDAIMEMKKLADNKNLFPEVITGPVAEAVAATLQKASETKPLYFKFSTSEGKATPQYPRPRVFENWYGSRGLADWQPATTAASMVKDNNRPLSTTAAPTAPAPAPQPAAPQAPPPQSPPTSTVPTPAEPEDISGLIAKAKGDPESPATAAAQARLAELAVAAGHPREEVDDAQTWEEVASMIAHPAGSTNGAAVGPQKGDVWKFVKIPLVDPKTKRQAVDAAGQPRYRSADVEVLAANPDGSFDLVDFTDKVTPYRAAHVSDLEPV